ncbi:MAG: N(2)-fixation sustaining protein CowN [Pseudomonadota bacterium]|nr:N(2)-fixation sustaining protein CowN [Pseudomonadota bacterium]
MTQIPTTDRYISFCGIECDQRADQLIGRLQQQLQQLPEHHPWKIYFQQKFREQARQQHDNLFYVGAQLNNLYSFFEEQGDNESLDLLWLLELECC